MLRRYLGYFPMPLAGFPDLEMDSLALNSFFEFLDSAHCSAGR